MPVESWDISRATALLPTVDHSIQLVRLATNVVRLVTFPVIARRRQPTVKLLRRL